MGQVIAKVFKRYRIFIILLLLLIVGTILSPVFLTSRNLLNVLRQLTIVGILAFAQMILIVSGNIDLSVGAVVAFSGIVSIMAYLATGSYVLAFLVAIVVAAVVMSISGVIIAYLRLPAFIVTLAMTSIARGATFILTGGQPIFSIGNYGRISSGFLGPIPIPVVFFFVVAILVGILMNKTVFGRNIYAIGGNQSAATASGISVPKTIISAYMVAGILTGIAAVLQFARINAGLPNTAEGIEGDAIAAAIIGGTSFTGGLGTVSGAFAGAIIMGLIGNILNLIGVQSYVQLVVKGIIIILALVLDLYAKNANFTVGKRLFKKGTVIEE